MGLDIAFAARIRRAADDANDDFNWTGLSIYVSDHPEHAARADGLVTGCYEGEETGRFRAGSYGGYNGWREKLSMLGMGVAARTVWNAEDEYRGQPFYEIVNFSDCEGAIGPTTSAKLADDFDAYAERAAVLFGEYDLRVYEDFRKAFRTAADSGVVEFT